MDGRDDRFLQSVHQIRRLFAVGIAVIVVCWIVVLPAIVMWGRYGEAHALASARVERAADQVSSYIAAHLDSWQFQTLRLPSLIDDSLRPEMGDVVWQRLSDLNDSEIYAHGVRGDRWPVMSLRQVVTDGRQPVGLLEVQMSLRHAVVPALAGICIGVALSLLLLWLVQLLARRVLDRALDRVAAVTGQLRERVAELDSTREHLAAQLKEREADKKLLAHHADNLALANQDLTHVAQLAAHHLQEPLRTVLAFSQLLVKGRAGDAEVNPEECVAFIRAGVRRMQTQLSSLSSYLALREHQEVLEVVNLGEVMEELCVAVAAVLGLSGASVKWGALPDVLAPRRHVDTLFHNLICHALRYARAGSAMEIVVSAERQGSMWRLAVTDNGLPLESRDPERMFHLLVHDENGTMDVGLAPCRRIVHMLGGTISAATHVGGGVQVALTLPAIR